MEEISGYRNGHLIYPISVLDHNPKEDGMHPGPKTVGTDEIIDNSVEMEDLNDSVKDKIQKTYDQDDEALHMYYDESDVNNSQQDVGQGGGEVEDLDDDMPGGELPDEMEIEEGD
jgi:hypothetical protein